LAGAQAASASADCGIYVNHLCRWLEEAEAGGRRGLRTSLLCLSKPLGRRPLPPPSSAGGSLPKPPRRGLAASRKPPRRSPRWTQGLSPGGRRGESPPQSPHGTAEKVYKNCL
jgi:hypothetical protein